LNRFSKSTAGVIIVALPHIIIVLWKYSKNYLR
jgi:hypothetical protein